MRFVIDACFVRCSLFAVGIITDCDPHPGNVACDAEGGGRLIYYDFGMMDELTTEVRTGFVNLLFGI